MFGRNSETQENSPTVSFFAASASRTVACKASGSFETGVAAGRRSMTWKSSPSGSGQAPRKRPERPGHTCQRLRRRPGIVTSAMIMRSSSSVSPVKPMPACLRTVLDPPSAPTT